MRLRYLVPSLVIAVAGVTLAKVNILGFWWENPLPYQSMPRGLSSLTAANCSECHQEIYAEWKASAHAHALSDLQFQEEMKKSPETQWLCFNCHTPLENQIERIAFNVRNGSARQPLFQTNPRFDAPLHQEAVTCAVCHVRDGVILGPYADSRAPHPVRQDRRLLTGEVCVMCHQATASYGDSLVCTFDTANEWKSGPYGKSGVACSSCHMPPVQRAVASGGPSRSSRRHFFFGSKIPKQMNLNASELGDYKLYRPGLSVQILSAKRTGDQALIMLKLKNARAGHMLPTGDPERFIRVDLKLVAGDHVIDSKSLRIGQKWEWWPKARKLGDNRLKPLEERTETVQLHLTRPAALHVSVSNGRLSEENARYHNLIGRYPLESKVLELGPYYLK